MLWPTGPVTTELSHLREHTPTVLIRLKHDKSVPRDACQWFG